MCRYICLVSGNNQKQSITLWYEDEKDILEVAEDCLNRSLLTEVERIHIVQM